MINYVTANDKALLPYTLTKLISIGQAQAHTLKTANYASLKTFWRPLLHLNTNHQAAASRF